MESAKVFGALDVGTSAHVEHSLTIGSGFALTPGGMTVDVETHSGTLFELSSRQDGFIGSLFELHAVGNGSSMIKTVINGVTTFELSSTGTLEMQGLKLKSGGVDVDAGGVTINAGGLQVNGGLSIESGGLFLKNQAFTAGAFVAEANADNRVGSLLFAKANSSTYSGVLVDLVSAGNPDHFSFLSAKTNQGAHMIDFYGDGTLVSAGGGRFKGAGGLHVDHKSLLEGGVAVSKSKVSAGVTIPIKSFGATLVVIEDDGSKMKNELILPSGDDVADGQILIICNLDGEPTSGLLEIPSQSTVMLIFEGARWLDVQALRAPMNVGDKSELQS